VLLPSHLFACIAEQYPDFMARMAKDAGQFWRRLRPADPKLLTHPLRHAPDGWQETCVPLAMHGDAGTFTRGGEAVVVLSWTSLLQQDDTWCKAFVFAAIPKSVLVKTDDLNTFDMLCTVLARDFEALVHGRHRMKDPFENPWPEGSYAAQLAGKDFASPFRAVMWLLVGDLDWFCNYLKVEGHYNGTDICWLDDANRSTHAWTDFSAHSAWRQSLYDGAKATVPVSGNPLFSVGGMTRFNICLDVMHTVCLGVASQAAGSALWTLIQERDGRTSASSRLEVLFREIRQLYRALDSSSRLSNLRITMFVRPREYAALSASAAETRCLIPVLARLTQQFTGTSAGIHRHLALQRLADFYDILESSGVIMTDDEVSRLQDAVTDFLLHYKWLSTDAARRGILCWLLVPKHHYMWHIGEHAAWINPRAGWAYQFENLIQKVLRVHKACAQGTPPHRIGHAVMAKYRAVLGINLRRSE